jgi:hypothetical protein
MEAVKAKAPAPVQPARPPKRTEEVRNNAYAQNKAKTAEAKPPQEPKPRPTTNAQGQRIGERLSVRA